MSNYRSFFVALRLELSEELAFALATIHHDLEATGLDISLIEPENYHITLAFMGSPKYLDALESYRQASEGLSNIGPQTVVFDRLDAFESRKFTTRILYAAPRMSPGLERIKAVYSPLADQEQTLHLTLARARSKEASVWIGDRLLGPRTLGCAVVSAVHLMANDGTSVYAEVEDWPLT